jgi:hypothetical protein
MVSASGLLHNGCDHTLPDNPASVGTPPFAAALVLIVPVDGVLFDGMLACGTGIFVAPPIKLIPGRLLAYAPLEITGCPAGGATTALAGATGTNCPFTTAENVLTVSLPLSVPELHLYILHFDLLSVSQILSDYGVLQQ